MYEHGMAAFALAEACAVARASGRQPLARYRQAAEKAIRFIYDAQHDDGGWRYAPSPHGPSDTSVTGWQVLALKSAREANIPVSDVCVKKAHGFFDACVLPNGRTAYQPGNLNTEATTGVGMLARQFLFDEADSPAVHEAAEYLAGHAEKTWLDRMLRKRDRDYYLWYNCTLAMFQAGGEPWNRWNNVVRDTLIELQEHVGCERGSWNTTSRWGAQGGRNYTTALATLTLEVYYRYAAHGDSAVKGPAGVAHTAEPATPSTAQPTLDSGR
jgi:hypothetical protein